MELDPGTNSFAAPAAILPLLMAIIKSAPAAANFIKLISGRWGSPTAIQVWALYTNAVAGKALNRPFSDFLMAKPFIKFI